MTNAEKAQELIDWLQSLRGDWLGDGIRPAKKRGEFIEVLSLIATPVEVEPTPFDLFANPPTVSYCCHTCFEQTGGVLLDRMIVCRVCGNKRCPKASNHLFECTNSNEPDQVGRLAINP